LCPGEKILTPSLSNEVIIAKIKTSRCNFDTDPSILAEMKHNGVPNEVLRAMIEAPYGPPRRETVKRPPASEINDPNVVATMPGQVIVLPEGEEFTGQTVDEISSNTASSAPQRMTRRSKI
jgi:hypothetical protein